MTAVSGGKASIAPPVDIFGETTGDILGMLSEGGRGVPIVTPAGGGGAGGTTENFRIMYESN